MLTALDTGRCTVTGTLKRSTPVVLFAALLIVLLAAGSRSEATAATKQISPLPGSPQAPARDTSAPRTGTGRIKGRVVAADTGMPVRRASVQISSPELRETRSVMTDAEGRYEITELPPGTYRISASKTGFMSGQAGGSTAGDLGKPVRLADREGATAEDIVLSRACAIAGRVVDEFGDPVANVQVRVLRSQSIGGVRRTMMASGTSTNDLGQYRAYGLVPGTYFVAADSGMRMGGAEVSDHAAYAPTYYPGTANFGEAAPIQLTAGQDMGGTDIMLAVVRTARVSGAALDAYGRPAPNSMVYATLAQQGSVVNASMGSGLYARVLPDGSFTLRGVPPGDYMLELNASSQPAPGTANPANPIRQYGRTRVVVGGDDIAGVTVQASVGTTVSGQVVFEGTPVPASKAKLSVTASPQYGFDTPVPSVSPSGNAGAVAADGSFTMAGVFGERVFRVSGLPTGWALKAVYVSGRETTDTPISLDGREQLTGVQIVVTDRITHVAVTVTDEKGQPADTAYAFVLPDDPNKLIPGSRFQRTMVTSSSSMPARFDALPAGDYVGLAFTSRPQDLDIYDPDFLERARKIGLKFSLREGETKDVTLKLAPLPDR